MRKKVLHSLAFSVFATLAIPVVWPFETAEATTVAPLSVEQLTDAATYVVRGDVTAVWTVRDSEGRVWTRAKVAVKRQFKGPAAPAELVVESLGGSDGEVSTVVFGAPRFSETEDVLLFIDQSRTGRLGIVGWSSGKYNVRRAPGDRHDYVSTVELDPRVHYDGRFLPHPAAKDRLDLEAFEARIQRRVDSGWDGKPIPGVDMPTLQRINSADRRIRR